MSCVATASPSNASRSWMSLARKAAPTIEVAVEPPTMKYAFFSKESKEYTTSVLLSPYTQSTVQPMKDVVSSDRSKMSAAVMTIGASSEMVRMSSIGNAVPEYLRSCRTEGIPGSDPAEIEHRTALIRHHRASSHGFDDPIGSDTSKHVKQRNTSVPSNEFVKQKCSPP